MGKGEFLVSHFPPFSEKEGNMGKTSKTKTEKKEGMKAKARFIQN